MQNKDQGPKLKWEQIAELMHEKIVNCQKTGKQCRERYQIFKSDGIIILLLN